MFHLPGHMRFPVCNRSVKRSVNLLLCIAAHCFVLSTVKEGLGHFYINSWTIFTDTTRALYPCLVRRPVSASYAHLMPRPSIWCLRYQHNFRLLDKFATSSRFSLQSSTLSVNTPTSKRLEALIILYHAITAIMLLSHLPYTVLLLALALARGSAASSDDKKSKPPPDPCTIASAGGSFFDLRPLSVIPEAEAKKPAKNRRIDSWHAKGYDYKSNFTLNICAPVAENVHDVQGVDKNLWKNISAYYEVGSKQYSLG
jgi:hypothetical protein